MARATSKTRRRIKARGERERTQDPSPVEQPEQKSAPVMLPAERTRPVLYGAAGVLLVSLSLFIWALAPTVTLVDSGELIVAPPFLCVSPPPGLPLYCLLRHLAGLVALGTRAPRV